MLPRARRRLFCASLRFPLIAKIAQIESALRDRKLQHKQHVSVPFHFKNVKIIACFHHLSDLIPASFRKSTGERSEPHCSAAPCSAASRTQGHGVWPRWSVGLEERETENHPCFNLATTTMDPQNVFLKKMVLRTAGLGSTHWWPLWDLEVLQTIGQGGWPSP